jgi:hypothetical protein
MRTREAGTTIAPKSPTPKGRTATDDARASSREEEVPLQVRVPRSVRRQVGLLCVERGESLRTLILRGLRSVGVDVPDKELVDRRGRRRE